ncbi:hypothetical protein BU17DRAFT_69292 [Hysterangium stoloniferum]|nr:hypothetical protein BU17DRAFT_69292 [Hysterangium stoloniferum]
MNPIDDLRLPSTLVHDPTLVKLRFFSPIATLEIRLHILGFIDNYIYNIPISENGKRLDEHCKTSRPSSWFWLKKKGAAFEKRHIYVIPAYHVIVSKTQQPSTPYTYPTNYRHPNASGPTTKKACLSVEIICAVLNNTLRKIAYLSLPYTVFQLTKVPTATKKGKKADAKKVIDYETANVLNGLQHYPEIPINDESAKGGENPYSTTIECE